MRFWHTLWFQPIAFLSPLTPRNTKFPWDCCRPSKWKVAKVNPIYKNQWSVEHRQNYKLIFVLPILSKLYESHLYEAPLYSHSSNNNSIYGLQSGFRKRHSTQTALIHVLDQILLALDKNHVTGVAFVARHFACMIDQQSLLQKISAYGVDEIPISRFSIITTWTGHSL
jgi:hypothetical protein